MCSAAFIILVAAVGFGFWLGGKNEKLSLLVLTAGMAIVGVMLLYAAAAGMVLPVLGLTSDQMSIPIGLFGVALLLSVFPVYALILDAKEAKQNGCILVLITMAVVATLSALLLILLQVDGR